MSGRFQVLVLAVVMLTVGDLVGRTVGVWRKGGEGGTVNLPAAKSRLMSPGGITTNTYRCGFQMRAASGGIAMALPSNLPRAIATFTYGGLVVSTSITSGKILIDGGELVKLQGVGVDSFTIDLDDGFDCYLHLEVVLKEDGKDVCVVLAR